MHSYTSCVNTFVVKHIYAQGAQEDGSPLTKVCGCAISSLFAPTSKSGIGMLVWVLAVLGSILNQIESFHRSLVDEVSSNFDKEANFFL